MLTVNRVVVKKSAGKLDTQIIIMKCSTLFSRKYIWRSHCLEFQNAKLLNDAAVVSQLGIKQNSILKFARLSHEQGQHRKAWHRNP